MLINFYFIISFVEIDMFLFWVLQKEIIENFQMRILILYVLYRYIYNKGSNFFEMLNILL